MITSVVDLEGVHLISLMTLTRLMQFQRHDASPIYICTYIYIEVYSYNTQYTMPEHTEIALQNKTLAMNE